MHSTWLVALVALGTSSFAMAADGPIPDKFMGKFKLERSENFDEFLTSKGVGWFTRQIIKLAGVTKVFEKGTAADTYNMENLSSKKNVKYEGWKLGEKFTAEGLDSTQHEITFDYKNDEVTEHHVRLDQPEFKPETYHYTVSDDSSYLILRMQNEEITCQRFFKRQ